MQMKILSIIVPVYNAAKYLDQCIDSLVSQTYKNLEIILVNDGSSDDSLTICQKWQKKDSRIEVINQENAGAGAARNKGLSMAKGSFITFVDADDYVCNIMYEQLIQNFDQCIDLVECNYAMTDDNQAHFLTEAGCSIVMNSEDAMKEHINNTIFQQVIWNKVYRAELVKDIPFPVSKQIDDEYWTYQVIAKAKQLKHIESVLYAYRQQESSVMHRLTIKGRIEAIESKALRHSYICNAMPNLVPLSQYNLWFVILFQVQKSLKEDKKESKQIVSFAKEVLRKYPIDTSNIQNKKDKFWLLSMKKFLVGTCYLRNILKKGV